jgi:hypothetical protein
VNSLGLVGRFISTIYTVKGVSISSDVPSLAKKGRLTVRPTSGSIGDGARGGGLFLGGVARCRGWFVLCVVLGG